MVGLLDQQAYNAQVHSATGVIRQKQDARCRRQHRFWLDTMKKADYWLDEQIEILKSKRQYSRAVRDGLRLFLDLKAGRTSVLFELFPMLRAQIENDLLREMMVNAPSSVAVGQGEANGHISQISQPAPLQKVAPPADDTPALTIKKAASDGKAASNFLSSAFALVD